MVFILIGVLLVIIAMPTKETRKEQIGNETQYATDITVGTMGVETDYKQELEMQLETILTQVEGVGEVKAMITFQTSNQKLIEKDQNSSGEGIEETTVYKEDDEGQYPYVYQEIYPVIEGVVITAQGGDNPVIIKNITEAVQALFEVESHKIKVMKMKYQK